MSWFVIFLLRKKPFSQQLLIKSTNAILRITFDTQKSSLINFSDASFISLKLGA